MAERSEAGGGRSAAGKTPRIAFVSTNSITQGEQVAQLWPVLFDRWKLEIAFAHRTFAWGSDARGKAHVHVVILGLARAGLEPEWKRLFSYQTPKSEAEETQHKALSPYLFDAGGLANPHAVVHSASRPLSERAPPVKIGSKPIDGGRYIFSREEREEFLAGEPEANRFLRPFVGAQEFLNGGERWILALHDASPSELRAMPAVKDRIAAVAEYRRQSASKPTQELAKTPKLFHVNVLPDGPFLVLPGVTSERREYAPIGYLEPPVIPSNLVNVALNASRADFAVLMSAMHMAWLRQIGGRLKSDYRYSIGLVYNTFPWPEIDAKAETALTESAKAILDARAAHRGATLADLYDPDAMPPDLRRAHRDNDRLVDRLYRKKAFSSERERVEHLFALYEKLRAPVEAAARGKPKRRSGRKKAAS